MKLPQKIRNLIGNTLLFVGMPALGIVASYRVARIARPLGNATKIIVIGNLKTDFYQLIYTNDLLNLRCVLFNGCLYSVFKRHLIY